MKCNSRLPVLMWSPTSDSRLNSLRYKQTNAQNHIKDYKVAYILTIYLSLNSYMRTCQHTHTYTPTYDHWNIHPGKYCLLICGLGLRAEQ